MPNAVDTSSIYTISSSTVEVWAMRSVLFLNDLIHFMGFLYFPANYITNNYMLHVNPITW